MVGGGGGVRGRGSLSIKEEVKELGCFPLTEQHTYMKLTMSRMVEMLFCPAPAECSPSLMY